MLNMRKDNARTSNKQRIKPKHKLSFSTAIATFALSGLSYLSLPLSVSSLISIGLFPGTASAKESQQSEWSYIEQAVISEHNQIRQNPQSYIPLLENYLDRMTTEGLVIHGCGQGCVLVTQESRAAVEEAIAFLRTQSSVDPIQTSVPVARAAKALAQEQQNGQTGHISVDGNSFLQRLERFGVRSSRLGENISYGATSAQDVIMRLLIDDGVLGREHRTNLFAPSWDKAGAGCGSHATYQIVCVIDYAD